MNIFFRDSGKEAELVEGRSILSYAQELGILMDASCGGEGTCGQCLVEVESAPGMLSERTELERKFIRDDGLRLACQATVMKTDAHIYVRVPRRSYCVLEIGQLWDIPIVPFLRHEGDQVFYESEEVGEYTRELYGIALDIGTTTLVMYLVDLETGAVLSVISRENPQIRYGNNVISRIEFARRGQQILEREIRIAVNEMISDLTDPQKVYEIVVAGNPVMRDLFFGYSVQSLGTSCLLYTSPSPRDRTRSRMPSSA